MNHKYWLQFIGIAAAFAVGSVGSAYSQQIAFDASSAHVYMANGQYTMMNDVAGQGVAVRGTVVRPTTFLATSLGTYRMTGVSEPQAVQVPIPNNLLSSSQGLTIRLVVRTAAFNNSAGGIVLSLVSNDGTRSLLIGHDNRSWTLGRSQNPSPNYDLLKQANFLWATPWDPKYDAPGASVIFYCRISPTGDALLDRFEPYYDSNGSAQVSWEEGLQQGAFSLGVLGVGKPGYKAPFANPPVWPPVTFYTLMVRGGTTDLIRDVSIKSSAVLASGMLHDVGSLIPVINWAVSQPALLPCNDGNLLNMNVNGSMQGPTPCGPFQQYTPPITDGTTTVHYGPPVNRVEYATGTPSLFLPNPVTNLKVGDVGGLYDFVWDAQAGADGYNYLLTDVTQTTNGNFVAGGTLTSPGFSYNLNSTRNYKFVVSPYNAMGVGGSQSSSLTLNPQSPFVSLYTGLAGPFGPGNGKIGYVLMKAAGQAPPSSPWQKCPFYNPNNALI